MKEQYFIGEFSKMTQITPRTLHYYDEIGLLCASRTEAGHRYYMQEDIVTLQKIVSLKFLGYSLETIKELLQKEKWDTEEYFTFQREEMIKKRDQLNHSIRMLEHAQKIIQETGELDREIFITLINSVQMQEEHKKWLQSFFPAPLVKKLYQQSEDKQLKLEEQLISIWRQVRETNLTDPEDESIQAIIHDILLLTKDILGENLQQFMARSEKINVTKEEQWLFPPSPFTTDEEEFLTKALEIYLQNNGNYFDE